MPVWRNGGQCALRQKGSEMVESRQSSSESGQFPASSPNLFGKRVLVVTDEDGELSDLLQLLVPTGIEVVEATNAMEAIGVMEFIISCVSTRMRFCHASISFSSNSLCMS